MAVTATASMTASLCGTTTFALASDGELLRAMRRMRPRGAPFRDRRYNASSRPQTPAITSSA